MRIGELASQSGVSVRALRYYEEQGLLEPARTPSGQRRYADSAVALVRFVQDMYAAGLPSRAVALLLPCVRSGSTNPDQRRMLRAERARIAERVERLQAALGRLDSVIADAEDRADVTTGRVA